MPRIAIVIILGVLCESLVAQAPSAEPPEDQAVQVEAEPTSPPTEDATPAEIAEPTVIVEKVYRIYSTSDDSEVGTFAIRAVETEQIVQVVVDISIMDYGGHSVEIVTSVDYEQSSADPVSAQAETSVDGQACMQGTIEFGETTYSYSGVGLLDVLAGQPLTTPLEFGEADFRPAGPIVFLMDFAVMAPRLLTEAGTLENLTVVGLPEDIAAPRLVTLMEGWLLVRDQADGEGNVTFSLSNRHRVAVRGPDGLTTTEEQTKLVATVTYDASGEIVDYRPAVMWRLVEVAQEELAEDDQPVEEAPSEEGDE